MPKLFDSNTPLALFLDNTHIGITDFTDFSVIAISGSDAKDFLQNMTSNDVASLLPGRNFQLSSFNNGKGRVEASFFLHRTQHDRFLMLLHTSLALVMLKKLTMFKLRSDVQLTLLEAHHLIALTGEGAAELTTQLTALPTPAPSNVNANKYAHIFNLPTSTPCLLVLTDFAGAQQIIEDAKLLNATPAQNNRVWQLFVESNLPMISAATSGVFVLQMINYDLIDGVNFKKGCYPGQEVVARMHYLGKPSRRTYLMQCDFDASITIGQNIVNHDGEAVGEIVNIAQINHDETHLLACIKVKALGDSFALENGETVTLLKQPYAVLTDKAG